MGKRKLDSNALLDPDFREKLKILIREESANLVNYYGTDNNLNFEVKPIYDQAVNEIIIPGKTNSFIVLGADRDGGLGSGYGGSGFTACAAIDLVAGHMGLKAINNWNGIETKASKNFNLDAARVYISQQADIDEYFSIPRYSVKIGEQEELLLENSTSNSAVAAKADCIRLVARENIKIVTKHLDTNSQNNNVTPGGVYIIAGCDIGTQDMQPQPMVRGDNLRECLREILKKIELVQAELTQFRTFQQKINNDFINHKHGAGTSETNISHGAEDMKKFNNDYIGFFDNKSMENYLSMKDLNKIYLDEGPKSIASAFNRVN